MPILPLLAELSWWAASPADAQQLEAALVASWPGHPFEVVVGAAPDEARGVWVEDGVLRLDDGERLRAVADPDSPEVAVTLVRAWLRPVSVVAAAPGDTGPADLAAVRAAPAEGAPVVGVRGDAAPGDGMRAEAARPAAPVDPRGWRLQGTLSAGPGLNVRSGIVHTGVSVGVGKGLLEGGALLSGDFVGKTDAYPGWLPFTDQYVVATSATVHGALLAGWWGVRVPIGPAAVSGGLGAGARWWTFDHEAGNREVVQVAAGLLRTHGTMDVNPRLAVGVGAVAELDVPPRGETTEESWEDFPGSGGAQFGAFRAALEVSATWTPWRSR